MKENLVKVALLAVLLALVYLLYDTVMEPIRFERAKEEHHEKVIERLKEIRSIQEAYREEHGTFAHDWDELKRFVREDSLTVITTLGDPDDPDAEVEKDTNIVPVRDSIFTFDYSVDRLPYIPGSEKDARFELKTDTLERGGIEVPVFRVRDTDPFDPDHVLQVGSLQETTTSGNWE